eukprot:TRINITY_DN105869_c0_g1_i1.p1 TRINITY_DN105869_c0_g1~~TRINITY_DN105869_c0_g1_i1.p1  ORF type:complete len:346 (+),score=38.36 TRINITY_DN105869_c0_g1_i1:41-1039(+)
MAAGYGAGSEARPRRRSLGMGGELNPELLLKTKEFSGRDPEFVKDVAFKAQLALFSDGDTILQQGDAADKLYCLKTGEVAIIVDEIQVATLGAGAIFGIAAMFDTAGKRNATVKAIGFCDCRVITRSAFQAAVENYPSEKAHFRELAAEQVRVSRANKLLAERKTRQERYRMLNESAEGPASAKLKTPLDADSQSQPTSLTPRPPLSLQDEEKRRARVQKVRDQIQARAGLGSVPASLGLFGDVSPRESRRPSKANASPRTSRKPSKSAALPDILQHGIGRALTPRQVTPLTAYSTSILSERAPQVPSRQNRSITLPDDLSKLFNSSISQSL